MAEEKVEMDVVDQIIRFEGGEMETQEEVITFFQHLIDTGLAWKLQGSYGRMADSLINNGYCKLA